MEWTEMGAYTMTVSKDVGEADLVMIGVFAPPAKAGDDDDEANIEKAKEEKPSVLLSGIAREMDTTLGGALSNLMLENAKEFKHGTTAGSTTPTLRVFKDGKGHSCV